MPEARIRSVRELRCGVWEVDIIDASRKRLRRRFRAESEDGARAAALASLPGPKACTLAEALDHYFEFIAVKGTARKTIANYRKECRALGAIAGCAVDSISPAAAACSLESAESRGISRVRCYRLKTICAAAGRHALADGLCASNPFSEVPFDVPRPPRKKRPISPSGLKAARALGASGSGHSAAAIGLALGCGLKPGEICGILADDLDAERMTVTVRGIWRESIGEPNFFVAYPEPSVMRLPAWLGGAPRSWAASAGSRLLLEKNGRRRDAGVPFTDDIFVVGDIDGAFMVPRYANQLFRTFVRTFGIGGGKCGLHRLRHTFATELIMSGVNPKTVSNWLGHTDPSFTLRIYVSSSPENLRASVDTVNEVMALPEGYDGQGSELPARIRGQEKKEPEEEPLPDAEAMRTVKIISWESLACG